jgi:ankyrin repeat protein
LEKVVTLLLDQAGEGSHYDFMQAVYYDNAFRVEAILSKHPDYINKKTRDTTALIVAADTQHFDMCLFLLNHGADINAREGNGLTPLHLAVIHNNYKLTKLLLEHGAKVNVKDYKYGLTPLQMAASNDYDEIVALLRKYGAK